MPRKRTRSKKAEVVEEGVETVGPETERTQEFSTDSSSASTAGDAVHTDVPHESRREERHIHRVKTVVHFKESPEESWREVIEISTVSKNGAAMVLSRPCPMGRLVSLVTEMPSKLRLYDHFARVYPVAGIVQNCMEITQDECKAYHVGVAFIGKQLPESYKNDPSTTYRLSGVTDDGLWSVTEMRKGFRDREHMRFWKRIALSLTYRDDTEKRTERAAVQTRDISRGGMAVWGPLSLGIGERVKISSKEHDFYSMGIVKNRTDHPRENSKSLVHIQFEQEFPVETIRRVDPKKDTE